MTPITPKERVRLALLKQPVDLIPTQINYTHAFGKTLSDHLHISLDELPVHLGNHLIRVDIDYPTKLSHDGKIRYDWWGVGFDTEEEGYYPVVNPLAENKDIDAFSWPDPYKNGFLDEAKSDIALDKNTHFIVPNFGFALFERAWSLRGLENFLLDLALDQIYASELLDRILEIQLTLIHRYIDLGVDGGYFGDDYGAQQNMLFSPKMWRTFIKPRLDHMFGPFREAGLPILMHSDGQIQPIIPDLIEIGLNALNPVQPEVLDHGWLQKTYGDTLAFYGGISTQTVLPNGTPQEVVQAVETCIDRLAPYGTGLLLAPSHRLMKDVPMDNFLALLDTFKSLGD